MNGHFGKAAPPDSPLWGLKQTVPLKVVPHCPLPPTQVATSETAHCGRLLNRQKSYALIWERERPKEQLTCGVSVKLVNSLNFAVGVALGRLTFSLTVEVTTLTVTTGHLSRLREA